MKVHFLGIGGIGVSALAQYYLSKGHEVSGEDLSSSEITDYLQKIGIKIFIQKNADTLDSLPAGRQVAFRGNDNEFPDLVVHTPAIRPENPALKKFIDKGVKTLTYPEALGELTKEYFTIAICGSHGKSTTTSMTALALIKAGLDPTVIVGTKLKEFGNTNFRIGHSKYLVIEACEHEESFLSYYPQIIIITNIEAEHLDYYKNLKNVIRGFQRFVSHLPKEGVLIINGDDKNASVIARRSQPTKQSKQLGLLRFARNDTLEIRKFSTKQKETKTIKKLLQIPGQHNVYNALAVLAIARELKIDDKITFSALSEFAGTWRRFETKKGNINSKNITVISDYGHHPTEVKATLKATREKFPKQKIWCVFQPHQYQRTFLLFKDFVSVLKNAKIDNIIVTDIYGVAGRENDLNKVSSEKLVSTIKKKSVIYIPQLEIENFVKQNIKEDDVLLIMGAGDIYKLYDKF